MTTGSLRHSSLLLVGLLTLFTVDPVRLAQAAADRVPVILDTDIGDDIDDTWALGMLVKSPELDVKLVLGDHGKNLYRARLLAKFLQSVDRTDIPVGIGADVNRQGDGAQAAWVQDYDLNRYPGKVHADGVRAMIDVIMKSPRPVTVIAIGPMPNLGLALRLEPRIAGKARVVGMHGSVRVGYGGSQAVHAEYNVKEDVKACQQVFTASWPITITPLDTCGLVDLQGDKYRQVKECPDPVTRAILENYRIWADRGGDGPRQAFPIRSSTLFDTVAIYLAVEGPLVTIEELGIRVTDDGFTRIDPAAHKIRVATAWKDRAGFEDFLVRRLTGK